MESSSSIKRTAENPGCAATESSQSSKRGTKNPSRTAVDSSSGSKRKPQDPGRTAVDSSSGSRRKAENLGGAATDSGLGGKRMGMTENPIRSGRDAIYAAIHSPSSDKIDLFIKSGYLHIIMEKRHWFLITISASTTIVCLKTMLQSQPDPWIPKKDLVLVKPDGVLLDDDHATVAQCGLSHETSLFACMEGSFDISIFSPLHKASIQVPVASIFSTVADVKQAIAELTDIPPDDQVLFHSRYLVTRPEAPPLHDDTTLFSLSIVKPYVADMSVGSHLHLRLPAYQRLAKSTLPRCPF